MASLPEHLTKAPVGREQLPRAVVEAHQRQRIVEAAIEVFAKRGYRGTTIDNIVAAAQIGVGSFYALFDGKEDCFAQAYDRIVDDARRQIAAEIPADAGWPEATATALRALLDLISANHLRARLAFVEIQTAGHTALDRYERTLEELVPILCLGRESSPLVDQLPASLEFAVLSGLAWYLQQRIVLGELDEISDALPEVLEIVVAPYLGTAEVSRLAAAAAV
jgi:AcrR family transcriptional regulator